MGQLRNFRSPFSNAQQVRDLARRYLERDSKITDAQMFAAGESLMRGVDVMSSVQVIYRWKLQSFLRFAWTKKFPEGISDDALANANAAARDARPDNDASVRAALRTLDAIPGVGIPVASAFLTAMHPTRFTVTDRQAYKSLGASFGNGISEYLNYLRYCHGEAGRLGVTLREHDQALWEYGKSLSKEDRACSGAAVL